MNGGSTRVCQSTRNALTLPVIFTHRLKVRAKICRVILGLGDSGFLHCALLPPAWWPGALFEQTFGLKLTALWAGAATRRSLYVTVGGFLAVGWTADADAGHVDGCPATHADDGDHACRRTAG